MPSSTRPLEFMNKYLLQFNRRAYGSRPSFPSYFSGRHGMRSTYLIAGAIVLALVAAGVLFGTDFFRKNPFHTPTEEELLVTQITEAASSGGGVAVTFAARDARLWQLAGGHKLERFSLDGGDAGF